MFREQIEYRDLLRQLATRDLLMRYKQTVMGFGWAIFVPVLNTAVFAVIFTRVAPLDTGMPYVVYAYSGLLAWNLFAASLRSAVTSLTANATLVTKVYFPREILPFAAILVSLVDFAVASLLLAALLAWYGVAVHWTVLLVPAVLAVHVVFTAALALLLSMANLFYRDVKYVFEVLLTVWMFASAVVYPVEAVGGTLGAVLQSNPMTIIIEAYRDALLRGVLPDAVPLMLTAAGSTALLLGSWVAFHRAELDFAESV